MRKWVVADLTASGWFWFLAVVGFECAIVNSAYMGRLVMLSAWKRSHRRLIRNAPAVKARWSVSPLSLRLGNKLASQLTFAQSAVIAVPTSSRRLPGRARRRQQRAHRLGDQRHPRRDLHGLLTQGIGGVQGHGIWDGVRGVLGRYFALKRVFFAGVPRDDTDGEP